VSEERIYHPENWQPLERWLPAPVCRRNFDWMWRQGQMECYRCRDSGQLLLLDHLGQCFEDTEVGTVPADFQQHYQRCTGFRYFEQRGAGMAALLAFEQREDEDDEDVILRRPPNDVSLPRLLEEWAAESQIEPEKREDLLAELRVFSSMFLSELEMQCRNLLNTAQYWLQ